MSETHEDRLARVGWIVGATILGGLLWPFVAVWFFRIPGGTNAFAHHVWWAGGAVVGTSSGAAIGALICLVRSRWRFGIAHLLEAMVACAYIAWAASDYRTAQNEVVEFARKSDERVRDANEGILRSEQHRAMADPTPGTRPASTLDPPFQLAFGMGLASPGFFSTYVGRARTDPDGTKHAGFPMALWPSSRITGEVTVYYPDLFIHDIVPVFGRLYRVSALGPPAGSGTTDWGGIVELVRLEPSDFPAGVVFHGGSIAIPLRDGKDGALKAHKMLAIVEEIRAGRRGTTESSTAKVRIAPAIIEQRSYRHASADPGGLTAIIRPGETLFVGGLGHKVRNIVPRDSERHIIGWVELDPDPVAADGKTKAETPK